MTHNPHGPLAAKKCRPCEGKTHPLTAAEAETLLKDLPGWNSAGAYIEKIFSFKNYYETTAFVNAVVWIAHTEDHHPDIEFGYKTCRVRYSTHSIKALSENDFICAAKIEALSYQH